MFSKKKFLIGQSSSKCPGWSVLTVIPPVLSFRYLFLVALLKSKGSWLTRFGYWVPNSVFRNSQRIAFRVNMKSYPSKVWMTTAQKWNKWLTHIEHRTGVAEKCYMWRPSFNMDGSQLYSVTEIALKSPALSELIFLNFRPVTYVHPPFLLRGLFLLFTVPL